MSLNLKKCKNIFFQDNKKSFGLCTDAKKLKENEYQIINNVIIDKISLDILKHPNIKSYVAIPSGKKKGTDKYYVLKPLDEQDKKDPKDKEYVYEKPKIKAKAGAYGSIDFYKNQNVAVKNFVYYKEHDNSLPQDFVKEVSIYKFLDMYCLPNFYGYETKDEYNIEIELGFRTLDDIIVDLNENKIRLSSLPNTMIKLLLCMRQINSLGIIHGDIKPQNIIQNNKHLIKFIDWGLATLDHSQRQKNPRIFSKYTLGYRAPELLLIGNKIICTSNYKTDIFAIGVIFLQLYLKMIYPLCEYIYTEKDMESNYPYILLNELLGEEIKYDPESNNHEPVYKLILNKYKDKNNSKIIKSKLQEKGVEERYADLFSHMLDFNPDMRWDYEKILIHSVFQDNKIPALVERKYNLDFRIDDINKIYENKEYDRTKVLQHMVNIASYLFIYKLFTMDAFCLSVQLLDSYMYKKKNSNIVLDMDGLISGMLLLTSKLFPINDDAPLNLYYILNGSTKDYYNKKPQEGRPFMPMLKPYKENILYKNEYKYKTNDEIKEFVNYRDHFYSKILYYEKNIFNTFDGNILQYTFYSYLTYKDSRVSEFYYDFDKGTIIENLEKLRKVLGCIVTYYYNNPEIYNYPI